MTTPIDSRYTNGKLITHTNLNNMGNDLINLHNGNFIVSGPGLSAVSTDLTTTSQVPVQMLSATPLTKNAGGSILVMMWGTFSISAGTGFIGVEVVVDVNNTGSPTDYLPANYDFKIAGKTSKTAISYSKIITIPNFANNLNVWLTPYWYTSSGGTLTLYNANTLVVSPFTIDNNPSVLVGGY